MMHTVLTNPGCKWAVSVDGKGRHLFCGQPRKENSPYCEAHHHRAHFTVVCDDAMAPPDHVRPASWNSCSGSHLNHVTLPALPAPKHAPEAKKMTPRREKPLSLTRQLLSIYLVPERTARPSGIVHLGKGRMADYRDENINTHTEHLSFGLGMPSAEGA